MIELRQKGKTKNDYLFKISGLHSNHNLQCRRRGFFGKVIGLNDQILFEGTSVAELKQAFAEAIEDYLTTCKNLGKLPDKAYKGSFNVRVPASLHKRAALVASQQHVTLNDFVKSALAYAVENELPMAFSEEQAGYKADG